MYFWNFTFSKEKMPVLARNITTNWTGLKASQSSLARLIMTISQVHWMTNHYPALYRDLYWKHSKSCHKSFWSHSQRSNSGLYIQYSPHISLIIINWIVNVIYSCGYAQKVSSNTTIVYMTKVVFMDITLQKISPYNTMHSQRR